MARQREPFACIGCREGTRRDQSAEAARTVEVDVRQRLGLRVVRRITVPSLVAVSQPAREAQRPPVGGVPVEADMLFGLIHLVGMLPVIAVLEVAAGMVISSTRREAEGLAEPLACRCRRADVVVAAVAHIELCLLSVERGQGMDIDESAERVASEEGALRSAQHLDGGDVRQIGLKRDRLIVRHAVDIERRR